MPHISQHKPGSVTVTEILAPVGRVDVRLPDVEMAGDPDRSGSCDSSTRLHIRVSNQKVIPSQRCRGNQGL